MGTRCNQRSVQVTFSNCINVPYQEALEHLQEALDAREFTLGEDHRDEPGSWVQGGSAYVLVCLLAPRGSWHRY